MQAALVGIEFLVLALVETVSAHQAAIEIAGGGKQPLIFMYIMYINV
jgi:hypothetical protein